MALGSKRPPADPPGGSPKDPDYFPLNSLTENELEAWEEREMFRTLKLMAKVFGLFAVVLDQGVKALKSLPGKKREQKQFKAPDEKK